jgi:hypothetical protein
MTYMPAVKKYVMVVSTCTWANGTKSTVGPFDTYFLESDAITGPFKMVSCVMHLPARIILAA